MAKSTVLIVDDDALLRRSQKGDLERLIRCALHCGNDTFEDGAHPFDLALNDGFIEGLVFRTVARRSIGREAAEVFRNEMEDRFELKAGGLPFIVLGAIGQDVETGLFLSVSAQLAGIFVSDPQVMAAVNRFVQRSKNTALKPVRTRECRHC